MSFIRFTFKFILYLVLALIMFLAYGLYQYNHVLVDNPGFKPSIKTPLLTQFTHSSKDISLPTGTQLNVYAINLDRSADRWQEMKPKLDKMQLTYFRLSAIDGKKIPSDILRMNLDENKFVELEGRKALNTEIGCYMSHYFAIQHFLQSSSSHALILEDDIDFNPHDLRIIIQDLLTVKNKWDISTLHPYHRGNPITITMLTQSKRNLVSFTPNTTPAAAYLLNRKAAHALLQKALPMKILYDDLLWMDWVTDLKYRGISPALKLHSSADKSTIDPQYTNRGNIYSDEKTILNSFTKKLFGRSKYLRRLIYTLSTS